MKKFILSHRLISACAVLALAYLFIVTPLAWAQTRQAETATEVLPVVQLYWASDKHGIIHVTALVRHLDGRLSSYPTDTATLYRYQRREPNLSLVIPLHDPAEVRQKQYVLFIGTVLAGLFLAAVFVYFRFTKS